MVIWFYGRWEFLLGSSHARTIVRWLTASGAHRGLSTAGVPGAGFGSAAHRRRLEGLAARHSPATVLLVLGGNDLCGRDFDLRELGRDLVQRGRDLLRGGISGGVCNAYPAPEEDPRAGLGGTL